MLIFWGKLIQRLDMSPTERIAIGAMIALYGVLRFSRLFKEEPEDEE
ncbi:MAG: hypothetical protein ACXVJP_13455 [Mucilaginibacter sp.]